jgi:hypothetical protein
LRLTSDMQQVDVTLVDRGGELHVTVRSPDPVLTTNLRAGVHDLVGGLERSGFRAETWHPGEGPRHDSGSPAASPLPGTAQAQFQAGEDPRRQGRNSYNPEYVHPRRAHNDSNREWMKEMTAITGAGTEI